VRVLFFSERLSPPFDEGIKNVAVNLLRRLREEHEALALTTGGANIPELGVQDLPALNRLLWSRELRRQIRAFRPDRICYLPTASMTLFAFLRARVLQNHGHGAPVTMLALQPRHQGRLNRVIVPHIAPERVIVQSRMSERLLAYLGDRVKFVPAGVDTSRFSPATDMQRLKLRERYGIDADKKVILHAGHINRNRNVGMLIAVAQLEGVHVILAGSSSTRQEVDLIDELRTAGVQVVTEYLPHLEEWYQLADLYLFPPSPATTPAQTPAIEVPLSVLEAMASDLPVVTTRFGGLPALFDEGEGLLYVDDSHDEREWQSKVTEGFRAGRGHTRRLVEPYSWQRMLDAVLGIEDNDLSGEHSGDD